MTRLQYPFHRARRLRQNASIRAMLQEVHITANDLIMPYFILEGAAQREVIASMPDIERLSIDLIIQELAQFVPLGLRAIALFPIIPDKFKNPQGSYALDANNLMCRAIKEIKQKFPEILIIADVALDPYTDHGHDGILDDTGYMLNDATIEILVQQSLNQVKAGADIIAPSDMCDGRIGTIRCALEGAQFPNIMIMAYSAKYASSLYGPFRDAVGSGGCFSGDKKNYQMDYANRLEALNEVTMDVQEGADIVMIKPAMFYLDIIRQCADQITVPICAYQVSGEYAMLQSYIATNPQQADQIILESLTAIKRAGSQLIISYFTRRFLLKT